MSRKEPREVVMVERESSSPIWWLLVGGAVGAGLALLFAPQPGDRTRRALSRKLTRLRESAGEMLDEFREAGADDVELDEVEDADEVETVSDRAEGDDEDEDEDEVEEVADGARAQLEKRLAAARARRQRALAEEDDEEPVA